MKKVFRNLLTLVMAATLSVSFTSCGPEDDEVYVSSSSINFGGDGGTTSVTVTSNTDWIVSSYPNWLKVSPTQGSDEGGTITLTASPSAEQRNGTIYIQAGDAQATINVTQFAATKITIKNSSNYPLYYFTVIFIRANNSLREVINTYDFDALYPGGTVTVDIPTGATDYYMATLGGDSWYASVDYGIEYIYMNLTDAEVGGWRATSSAIRYPVASHTN